MGRPLKQIDEEQVFKLATMQCTNKEIAAFFDINIDTVTDRFSEIIAKGKEVGKAKLRRLQWQAAERGNVVMMIFLGKQLLAQSDKIEHKTEDISKKDRVQKLVEALEKISEKDEK